MDKIYLRKVIKLAFAIPLAYSLMLVLDVDIGSDFLGLLLVYIGIFIFPDPIRLKGFLLLKLLGIGFIFLLAGAFTAGLWGINSIVIFIFILLAGLGTLMWMPAEIANGNLCNGAYLGLLTLTSTRPYTQAAYYFLVVAIGIAVGLSVERLFWPIFDQQNIERQVSQTFRIFQEMSDRAFGQTELSSGGSSSPLSVLTSRGNSSLRAINKALKIASMTGSLSPLDRDRWTQAVALQGRLLTHLCAISQFLQENKENPLLHELDPELSALGHSLSSTFARLSMVTVSPEAKVQLPNPSLDFQNLQSRLTAMREAGAGGSFDLTSRLGIGLIERGIETLVTDISQVFAWQEKKP